LPVRFCGRSDEHAISITALFAKPLRRDREV